ncbi:MAG: hypothetical protein ABIH28_01565 [archaeon]
MDPNFMQQRMNEFQKNQDFAAAYSKLISGGRAGYKAVIETRRVEIRCKGCNTVLDPIEKFCHEWGQRLKKPRNKKKTIFQLQPF